jgi:hypothetical protein
MLKMLRIIYLISKKEWSENHYKMEKINIMMEIAKFKVKRIRVKKVI